MTHTQVPGVAAQRAPFLTERENQRAVDLIEAAEGAAPYCPCGRHTIAVAEGRRVWLECSGLREQRAGLAAVFARVTAFSHTRQMIVVLPPVN